MNDNASTWPTVSVIMPVLNEERHLADAVSHILGQDYPGEIELVIALGPSRDRTDAIAAGLCAADPRVRTVPNPSGRTPAALNAAIDASRHEIVVRVDGHGLLSPGYITAAVRLLRETGAANVGGVMHAEGVTVFERAVAIAMTSKLGVGNAKNHTGGEPGPADTVYLGVFRREVLEKHHGYNEAFIRAQDWELNHRIREGGDLIYFSPELHVTYRPRPNFRTLARQYFEYGRWRRVVMRTHSGTASLRYLAPPLAVLAVILGTLMTIASFFTLPWLAIGSAAPIGYLMAIFLGSIQESRGQAAGVRLRLPLVLVTMHFSWGWGFLTSPKSLYRSTLTS
ncbi:glycosyltransferase family 2 protein [Actinospica sp. MGRD01-02]|uniref:Glycosyltransferase family 2 protein n=1 Tax=Actinospica acidithermotolerans TaxID=2828514 RepID=A0A941EEK1_9ACTN|nr:glycosyltransferase family 2 protein [Actinospica acidithermotolerans]MBR7829937.1 glycosyltransferase family 2 protein [Actinospica acidithermotolerans]